MKPLTGRIKRAWIRKISKDAKALYSKRMITEQNKIESNLADDVRCSVSIRNIENDTENLSIDIPPHDQLVVANVTLSEVEQTAVNSKEPTASATNEMSGKVALFNPETGNGWQRAIVARLDTSSSQVEMNRNQDTVDEIVQAAR